MSEEWARRTAARIGKDQDKSSQGSKMFKIAEKARSQAPRKLFALFKNRISLVCKYLKEDEKKKHNAIKAAALTLLELFSKQQVFSIETYKDVSMRFQLREALGERMEIFYNKGKRPGIRIDVALYEQLSGQLFPIFRDNSAIAGAQIWRLIEGKHPDMITRLYFILSKTAVDEGVSAAEAACWIDEQGKHFNEKAVEDLIDSMTLSA
ncbi:MAG: hypothetical protein RMM17_09515 [Acidobacteriota bacterium]|nr:hypothetical protein [Blastocatellia bacterium]MDW8412907.1 hypothetical protein [Acidobacteriota bacterium]